MVRFIGNKMCQLVKMCTFGSVGAYFCLVGEPVEPQKL